MFKKDPQMEEIKALKKGLAPALEAVEKQKNDLATINSRKKEFSDSIASMNSEVGTLEKEQSEAVTRYAKGEVSGETLDGFQERISALQARKKNVSAALGIVEAEITKVQEKLDSARKALQEKENAIWGKIYENELGKAVPQLKRAFAAFQNRAKGRHWVSTDPHSFLTLLSEKMRVELHVQEVIKRELEGLAGEYLG